MKAWRNIIPLLLMAWGCGEGTHLQIGESDGQSAANSSSSTLSAAGSEGAVLSFSSSIKPIFQSKCSSCHQGGALADWTQFDVAKLGIDRIKLRVLDRGDMPKVGSLSADEKALVAAWIKAGGSANFSLGEAKTVEQTNTAESSPGPSSETAPGPSTETVPGPNPEPAPEFKSEGEKIVKSKCLACHGGQTLESRVPFLHGQSKGYVENQLKAFRENSRPDGVMNGVMNIVAQGLTESDVKEVASYLESAGPCVDSRPSESLEGDIELGRARAMGCQGCHQSGNALGAPVLEGQSSHYLQQTLQAFRSGKRSSPIMNGMAAALSDDDISNLSSYYYSQFDIQKCK